jgi:hypothetical protein
MNLFCYIDVCMCSQREAKELYRSFTDQVVSTTMYRPNPNRAVAKNSAAGPAISSNGSKHSAQVRQQPAVVGSLLGEIHSDRNRRQALVRLNPDRSSRFAGQFVVGEISGPLSNGAPVTNPSPAVAASNVSTNAANNPGKIGNGPSGSAASDAPAEPLTQLPQSRAMIVSHPCVKDFKRPDAPRRNEKRSAAFIVVSR